MLICVCVCVCVCVCALRVRMVYMDKILHFINTLIIIYYKVRFWNMLELGDYAIGMQPKYQMNVL